MKKYNYFKISFLILTIILFWITPNSFYDINDELNNISQSIVGKKKASNEIILINIDENDVANLGWPLKRNYYALLINKLNLLNVKQIGFEVFLSRKMTFQSAYNSLLANEIKNSKPIILSSIIKGIQENDKYSADSINLPQFYDLENVEIGHITYLEKQSELIPNKIEIKSKLENSFSYLLAKNINNEISEDNLYVNYNLSWKDFKHFSLLEFFQLIRTNSDELKNFNNKTIIIGVSDFQIAKNVTTLYDKHLPGIGFHAIAINNLLNNEGLNFEFYYLILIVSFPLLIFLALNDQYGKIILNLILLIFFLLVGFLSLTTFFAQILISPIVLVLFLFSIIDLIKLFDIKQTQLGIALSESQILQNTLKVKELELLSINQEIKNNPVVEKLKAQIELLKKYELDNKPGEIKNVDVENFEGIVYKSKLMDELKELICKVSDTDATVLITGESGSGKELVANALHNLSSRKNENFIALNCAALPEQLLESELFGHVKGAFTNAIADKKGKFELANNGTIFLDEIGETSLFFQAKLLRVLQNGEYDKIGSEKTMVTNARIVAATNKNLQKLVKEQKFREDLFYRLNIIQIQIPSLRERKEDIPILADFFAKNEDETMSLSKVVLQKLIENDWKGNVRELQSVIKRAVIFAKGDKRKIIKLVDLSDELNKIDSSGLEQLILDSLREKKFSHSSINETAKELGNLNRTIISENLRGICLKYYCLNNFDVRKSAEKLSDTMDEEIIKKFESKLNTYLRNVKKDVEKNKGRSFNQLKIKFSSKYKNLPQKYHQYLDNVIQHII